MYLSRLVLNPASRRVQRELAQPYELHRTIMRAFPATIDKHRERVLFRVDRQPPFDAPALLVQSQDKPDWSWVGQEPGARGYLLSVPFANPDCKPLNLSLTKGQLLSFRLRANPTIKRAGKRLGLSTEEEQTTWLLRKGKSGGFRVLRVNVAREPRWQTSAERPGDTRAITMVGVRYDGLLEVTDGDAFLDAVHQGVGSGKGFGFGLLSLAPTSG